ncbi:efflux RND transporter periplasmic adaptor subunit [Anthocerotibacter panamensis]|uniref:efflux RND transporter periplasmic adaptor subunit n=1 Tax=Anthocerotibacter panamensis TaxID=2857077 RepID=UPI001C40895F|nr:efflux RND transporter periplasmic adaptor subunit [Anthocerotibacter panamensis]
MQWKRLSDLSKRGAVLPILFVLAACSVSGKETAKVRPGIPVKLSVVTTGVIHETSEYVGRVASRRSVVLQPQIEGQVTQILVRPGDRVAAGALLIQVDPARQQATLSSVQAQAQSDEASLQSAQALLKSYTANRLGREADVEFAQQEYQRFNELFKSGAVSKQQLDQANNRLRSAQSDLAAIQAQIQAQQATIVRAQREYQKSRADSRAQQVQLQYYRINAPFAGIVGDIPVKVGDAVTPATRLTSVTQNDQLEVALDIPIERAPELRLDMPVELLDRTGQMLGTSKLFFIAPQASTDTQSIQIKSIYDNRKGQLRADQFIRARVVWDRRPGVLVPTSAVSQLGGQDFIFVAEGEPNKLVARQKLIQVGNIAGNTYPVLQGLKPGEKIITSGTQNLTDGTPITPES